MSRVWIGIALVAAVVAMLAFVTRRPRDRAARLNPDTRRIEPASLDRITIAIRAGHKIEAIKLMRESSGLGLAEAKEAVERIERDLPALLLSAGSEARTTPPLDAAWLSEVRAALDSGDTIAAIKIYRERAGVGLAEAKAAVDALRERR